jgi:DNA repair exonuclease SbcCD ATPase subunit
MSATTSLESLRDTLAGEHSQLEAWVRESFAAMEALQGELSEWQRELTREQAALDQREAAVKEANVRDSEALAALEQQLTDAREEARQLEEDNAEQLQAVEELDRQLALSTTELRLVTKRADELSAALDAEREKAAEDGQQFTAELRELRRMMERQGDLLERLVAAPPREAAPAPVPAVEETVESGGLAAELLRRASSRRAQRRTT